MITLAAIMLTGIIQKPAYDYRFRPIAGGYRLEVLKRAGGVLWSRTTFSNVATWSMDRTVLAYADTSGSGKWDWIVSYWRVGRRVQHFNIPPLRPPLNDAEGIFGQGIRISPDNRYIAVRVAPTQGAFAGDIGRLICVDSKNGRFTEIGNSSGDFAWRDSHTLVYGVYGKRSFDVIKDWRK